MGGGGVMGLHADAVEGFRILRSWIVARWSCDAQGDTYNSVLFESFQYLLVQYVVHEHTHGIVSHRERDILDFQPCLEECEFNVCDGRVVRGVEGVDIVLF